MLPIISVCGRAVGSYALFAMLGLAACATVVCLCGKRLKMDVADVLIVELVIAAGMLVGGHLLYGLVNLKSVLAALDGAASVGFAATVRALTDAFGGMVFYGGFLGGLAALWLFIRRSQAAYKSDLPDVYAFSVPLFHCFGRVGCFFAGCCYGVESEFGFLIEDNPLVPQLNGVRRFPVALLEAALTLLLFCLLFYWFRKGMWKRRLLAWYLVLYAVIRFGTEWLRGDAVRGIYFGLSTSQWISICLFLCGIPMLAKAFREKRAAKPS